MGATLPESDGPSQLQRGIDPHARPVRTALQERLADEVEQHRAMRIERAQQSPDAVPELDRELTMIEGALHGVHQRLGTLLGALTPVLDPKTVDQLLGNEATDRPTPHDSFEIKLQYGHRLRAVQTQLGEIENVLGQMAYGVRA